MMRYGARDISKSERKNDLQDVKKMKKARIKKKKNIPAIIWVISRDSRLPKEIFNFIRPIFLQAINE